MAKETGRVQTFRNGGNSSTNVVLRFASSSDSASALCRSSSIMHHCAVAISRECHRLKRARVLCTFARVMVHLQLPSSIAVFSSIIRVHLHSSSLAHVSDTLALG